MAFNSEGGSVTLYWSQETRSTHSPIYYNQTSLPITWDSPLIVARTSSIHSSQVASSNACILTGPSQSNQSQFLSQPNPATTSTSTSNHQKLSFQAKVLSREHATLRLVRNGKEGEYVLNVKDLGSTHGTYLSHTNASLPRPATGFGPDGYRILGSRKEKFQFQDGDQGLDQDGNELGELTKAKLDPNQSYQVKSGDYLQFGRDIEKDGVLHCAIKGYIFFKSSTNNKNTPTPQRLLSFNAIKKPLTPPEEPVQVQKKNGHYSASDSVPGVQGMYGGTYYFGKQRTEIGISDDDSGEELEQDEEEIEEDQVRVNPGLPKTYSNDFNQREPVSLSPEPESEMEMDAYESIPITKAILAESSPREQSENIEEASSPRAVWEFVPRSGRYGLDRNDLESNASRQDGSDDGEDEEEEIEQRKDSRANSTSIDVHNSRAGIKNSSSPSPSLHSEADEIKDQVENQELEVEEDGDVDASSARSSSPISKSDSQRHHGLDLFRFDSNSPKPNNQSFGVAVENNKYQGKDQDDSGGSDFSSMAGGAQRRMIGILFGRSKSESQSRRSLPKSFSQSLSRPRQPRSLANQSSQGPWTRAPAVQFSKKDIATAFVLDDDSGGESQEEELVIPTSDEEQDEKEEENTLIVADDSQVASEPAALVEMEMEEEDSDSSVESNDKSSTSSTSDQDRVEETVPQNLQGSSEEASAQVKSSKPSRSFQKGSSRGLHRYWKSTHIPASRRQLSNVSSASASSPKKDKSQSSLDPDFDFEFLDGTDEFVGGGENEWIEKADDFEGTPNELEDDGMGIVRSTPDSNSVEVDIESSIPEKASTSSLGAQVGTGSLVDPETISTIPDGVAADSVLAPDSSNAINQPSYPQVLGILSTNKAVETQAPASLEKKEVINSENRQVSMTQVEEAIQTAISERLNIPSGQIGKQVAGSKRSQDELLEVPKDETGSHFTSTSHHPLKRQRLEVAHQVDSDRVRRGYLRDVGAGIVGAGFFAAGLGVAFGAISALAAIDSYLP